MCRHNPGRSYCPGDYRFHYNQAYRRLRFHAWVAHDVRRDVPLPPRELHATVNTAGVPGTAGVQAARPHQPGASRPSAGRSATYFSAGLNYYGTFDNSNIDFYTYIATSSRRRCASRTDMRRTTPGRPGSCSSGSLAVACAAVVARARRERVGKVAEARRPAEVQHAGKARGAAAPWRPRAARRPAAHSEDGEAPDRAAGGFVADPRPGLAARHHRADARASDRRRASSCCSAPSRRPSPSATRSRRRASRSRRLRRSPACAARASSQSTTRSSEETLVVGIENVTRVRGRAGPPGSRARSTSAPVSATRVRRGSRPTPPAALPGQTHAHAAGRDHAARAGGSRCRAPRQSRWMRAGRSAAASAPSRREEQAVDQPPFTAARAEAAAPAAAHRSGPMTTGT